MRRLFYPVCLLTAGCGLIVPGRFTPNSDVVPPVPSIDFDPTTVVSPADALDRAADAIGRGDTTAATFHLTTHVRRHPDQLLFRLQLAELLFRQDRWSEASHEFETIIAIAQVGPESARKHLVHSHTRLMEIAQEDGDLSREKLHRGIGLYLIANQLVERDEDVQALCFKAIKSLNEAHEAQPVDGRASWYLYKTWRLLQQSAPAERSLRIARSRIDGSTMTDAEKQEMSSTALQ